MKKILILLLLAVNAQAADNRITILNSATITMSVPVREDLKYGEIKIMCIAGYKWLLVKVGGYDSSIPAPQPITKTQNGVTVQQTCGD